MGWFNKVLKYGTTPGWLGLWGNEGGDGGPGGWGVGEHNWMNWVKANNAFTEMDPSKWANLYEGDFSNFLDTMNQWYQHAPGTSAAPSQIRGTVDWATNMFERDPLMFQLQQEASKIAGKDYQSAAMGAARQGADLQGQQLSNALASRGGGNIGAASAAGAQTRAAGELGGMQQGLQMQMSAQNPLLSALGMKYNVINQLVSAKMGQQANLMNIEAQKDAANKQMWGQMIGGGLGGVGNVFGGWLAGR